MHVAARTRLETAWADFGLGAAARKRPSERNKARLIPSIGRRTGAKASTHRCAFGHGFRGFRSSCRSGSSCPSRSSCHVPTPAPPRNGSNDTTSADFWNLRSCPPVAISTPKFSSFDAEVLVVLSVVVLLAPLHGPEPIRVAHALSETRLTCRSPTPRQASARMARADPRGSRGQRASAGGIALRCREVLGAALSGAVKWLPALSGAAKSSAHFSPVPRELIGRSALTCREVLGAALSGAARCREVLGAALSGAAKWLRRSQVLRSAWRRRFRVRM